MFATLVVVAALAGAPKDPELAARAKVHRLETRLRMAAESARDHTALFYKREWIDGALQPAEHVALKWRAAAPGRGPQVVMEWVGGAHEGRKLLWRGDRTMKVKAGLLTLDLDVDGRIARTQSRNSVREAGATTLARLILLDVDRAQLRKHRGVSFEDLGDMNVHGARAHCWRATLPKDDDPKFYAKKSEVCVDARTGLPSVVKVWDDVDGRLELVEEYSFADLRVNVGLTDNDFDPDRVF